MSNCNVTINGRTIYLADEITDESAGCICSAILNIIAEDDKNELVIKEFIRKPIKLFINTPGGSVTALWSIVDIMLASRTHVFTYSSGRSFSCGAVLLAAGYKRFVYRHSEILIHTVSWKLNGDLKTIHDSLEHGDYEQKMVDEFFKDNSKITQEKLDEITKEKIEWYLTPEEAIKLGIVDDWATNDSKYLENGK